MLRCPPDVGRSRSRADRDGGSTGREYYIDVAVTDDAGNQVVATATVTVPHDQGKKKGK